MSTFDQLTQLTLGNLQGFSLDQDQITYLTAGISSSDLTVPVANPQDVSRGLVEIGDELLWARLVDAPASMMTIAPEGRGWLGSTAASHGANATIHNNPKFPRLLVKRALNDTLAACYPDLFQVRTTTFSFTAARYQYALPAEAEDVYDVSWDVIGPSARWPKLSRWRFVPNANSAAYPTGRAIELLDAVVPGRTVQVSYLVRPTQLVSGSDDFTTTTGLASSAEDVVMYGACYRMSGYLDIPRLQGQSVEGSNRSSLVPPGSAVNASKYFYALHKERLAQEREILLSRYPRTTHMTRR